MHISVTCPRCDSRYQVEPNLRGMNMRCPNPLCRTIFEVRVDGEEVPAARQPPPAAPRDTGPPKQLSGSVGEIVPMIQAEAVPVAMPVPEQVPSPAAPVPVVSVAPIRVEPGAVSPPPVWDKTAPPVRRPVITEEQRGPASETDEKTAAPTVREKSARPPRLPAVVAKQPSVTPPAAPAQPSSWEQGPPPVRRSLVAESLAAPSLLAEAPEDSDFLSAEPENIEEPATEETHQSIPGTWEAPPVRLTGLGIENAAAASAAGTVLAEAPASAVSRRSRRRARWLVVGLLLLLAGGLGSGFYIAHGTRAGNEAERFKKAEDLFDKHSFAEAAAELQSLHRDFPESMNVKHYLFLKELASIRDAVDSSSNPVQAWASVRDFLNTSRGDPLLKTFAGDIWDTLFKLARQLLDESDQRKDRRVLALAREALAQASRLEAPRGIDPIRRLREAEAAVTNLEQQIAAIDRRRGFLDKLKGLAQMPSADAVRQVRALLRDEGFGGDAEFLQLVRELITNHRAGVTYTPVSTVPEQKPAPADQEPSLIVMPLLLKFPGPAPMVRGTLFALVRGVLHALDAQTGELRWARRVGVDTVLLPLRLPVGPAAPAVAILTSSDQKTVWAVAETSGKTIWEHRMDGPCLGQAVLVGSGSGFSGNRLLIPGYSGRVDELELSDGRLLGSYQLGQPLTVSGVHHPGTSFVYFPADSYCVYVLDVARHACAGVLYSGHPPGSLRSAPVIVAEPGAGPEGKGLLVLPQEAENDDAVKLRTFALPITHPDQAVAAPELKIPGWSWFPPYQDGERLALATDAGMFALFGIGQKGNRDPLFFPLLKNEVSLDSTRRTRFGRAQIVHADAENFWVLAHGRLQRLELTFTRQAGPKVIYRWPEPPLLGSPLHEAQVLKDESGRALLFLVTRLGGGQTCLANLVDAETGRLVWQRQVGIGGHGLPLQVGDDIIVDDRSGVLRFDAAGSQGQAWRTAGELLAPFSLQQPARRFAFADQKKKSAFVLHFAGTALKVIHYQSGTEKKTTVTEHTLPRPLAGTPCLGPDYLILPLDHGVLERVPLAGGPAVHGPDWRAPGAEEGALGHVVTLPDSGEFIYTDGSRGLKLIHWADPKLVEPKAKKELTRRIIGAPVVIPAAAAGKKLRVCVADADDTLILLDAENLGEIRTWRMPGKISAGPFVRGSAIGCVVAGNRLVWIDPDKEQPLWEYTFETDIVGEPPLVKDMVVVASLAGHIISLDPTTGRPLGPGYTLRANVAPASTPLPFAADRLFVPLTDGTIMLLAQKRLLAP